MEGRIQPLGPTRRAWVEPWATSDFFVDWKVRSPVNMICGVSPFSAQKLGVGLVIFGLHGTCILQHGTTLVCKSPGAHVCARRRRKARSGWLAGGIPWQWRARESCLRPFSQVWELKLVWCRKIQWCFQVGIGTCKNGHLLGYLIIHSQSWGDKVDDSAQFI